MLALSLVALLIGSAPDAAAPRKQLRVAIDPGHGAKGNDGNTGCHCQLERDHTMLVARELAEQLPSLGPFEVLLLRSELTHPTYAQRIRRAEKWKADVIISIHSDVRGYAYEWRPFGPGGLTCIRNDEAAGFAVLWNDHAAAPLVEARQRLGRAISSQLISAGFTAYNGEDYGALYRADDAPGGWIDIRPKGRDVYFLRASERVPTVIIETHHALNPAEVEKWALPATRRTFAAALAAAVLGLRGTR